MGFTWKFGDSESVKLGWGPRFCVSHHFPGEVYAAAPQAALLSRKSLRHLLSTWDRLSLQQITIRDIYPPPAFFFLTDSFWLHKPKVIIGISLRFFVSGDKKNNCHFSFCTNHDTALLS